MDGINGMMGCLTLACLLPAMLINYYVIEFIDERLFFYILLPTIIFLFLNFRNKPKCFSGDVGSIIVGFTLTYIIAALVIASKNYTYVFLLAVVYIDAGITVLQRLLAGQNIFKPHRIHLFQLLSNEMGINHLKVSSAYGLLQLVIGLGLFAFNYYQVPQTIQMVVCITLFLVMCLIYFLAKRRLMGGHFLHMDERFIKQANN